MQIFNTMTRQKEEFTPQKEGEYRIYVCGPTVYNYIHIGNARPMIVFDTSSPALNNEQLKRVFTAAVSSWIDRLLQGRDGRRRIVVDEEAWDLLSNARLVDSLQTRQRSAGHWGCATWLIVHGVNDMTHVFGEGSELRGRVEEILNQMQTKIIFRQGGSNIDMLSRLVDHR